MAFIYDFSGEQVAKILPVYWEKPFSRMPQTVIYLYEWTLVDHNRSDSSLAWLHAINELRKHSKITLQQMQLSPG